MDQGVDPMKADIDWQEFRERQQDAALDTVKSTLVIDEIARRESIEPTDEDVARRSRVCRTGGPHASGRPRAAGEGRGGSTASGRASGAKRR